MPATSRRDKELSDQIVKGGYPVPSNFGFLEQKVEYLNSQLLKLQKQLEVRSAEAEQLKIENGKISKPENKSKSLNDY